MKETGRAEVQEIFEDVSLFEARRGRQGEKEIVSRYVRFTYPRANFLGFFSIGAKIR